MAFLEFPFARGTQLTPLDQAPAYLSRLSPVLAALLPQQTASHGGTCPALFWPVLSFCRLPFLDFRYGLRCYLQREVYFDFPGQSQASVSPKHLGYFSSTGSM